MSDADAMIRAIFRDPLETVPRLAFADWLEETGAHPNLAWANYLRRWAEAQQLPKGSQERKKLVHKAATYVPHIAAQLTIPIEVAIKHFRVLHFLLPTPYITVNLAEHAIPIAVFELMPESVARENLVLPLALQSCWLLVVSAEPVSEDMRRRVEFILNRDIVAIRGEADDILDAINRHYGQTETESVSCAHYDMPVFSLVDVHDFQIAHLIHAGLESQARGFVLKRMGESAEFELIDPQRTDNGPSSFSATLIDTLSRALSELEYTAERRFPDRVIRDVEATTVGNRIQRYTVEIDTSEPCSAVTLRFNWQ